MTRAACAESGNTGTAGSSQRFGCAGIGWRRAAAGSDGTKRPAAPKPGVSGSPNMKSEPRCTEPSLRHAPSGYAVPIAALDKTASEMLDARSNYKKKRELPVIGWI